MARVTAEQKLKTRAEVYDAAKVEFEAHGFEDASLRAIAKRAKVATGTLFNYADGKLGLLHAVFFEELEKVVLRVRDVSEELLLIEQIVEIFGLFFDYYAQKPDLSRVFLKESLFSSSAPAADFRKQAQSVAEEIERRLLTAHGCPSPEGALDPKLITLTAVSAYYFSLISGFSSGCPQPIQQRHLLRIQLQQIMRTQ